MSARGSSRAPTTPTAIASTETAVDRNGAICRRSAKDVSDFSPRAGWRECCIVVIHQGPARVLTHLAWLAARYPSPLLREKLTYLQKREAHMQYPTYQAAGWPIGSGSVESANKLVVEARLKGAGMRWRRQNVNPMLVLCTVVGFAVYWLARAKSRVHDRYRSPLRGVLPRRAG